jgi:hypothetical protein
MKGMLRLPLFWEWNYIETLWKCKPYKYLNLIKGMILCEELNFNSWGKRKNNCYP